MSAVPFLMPKLAMAMNEGTVTAWHVASGDAITKGQEIATVETEKVAYEVEAPQDGFIRIVASEGEVVPVETPIAIIAASVEALEGGAEDAVAAPEAAQVVSPDAEVLEFPTQQVETPKRRIKITPLAKRIARNAGFDYSDVKGTGPGGRIKRVDVEQALAAREAPQTVASVPSSTTGQTLAASPMRKAIADRMRKSLQSTAQLSANWEADVSDLLAFRKRLVGREDTLGVRVSMNAVLAKIVTQAALDVPIVNSQWDGDNIRLNETVNLAFAVAVPDSHGLGSTLMVPVIHDVEKLSLVEIQRKMTELAEKARAGQLGAADQSGSTLTFSSTAGLAPPGCVNTPILNAPNAALVGVSTTIDRPVVKDGEVVVRTMMPISLTFDHSLVDGEPVARFASALHARLEEPALLTC